MSQQHVVLLYGGQSSEHEVSLLSARNIYTALRAANYRVDLICISKDGEWRWVESVREPTSDDLAVRIDISQGLFVVADRTLRPDVVFPALHGKYGEDGTIQGLLDMMHLPYVGCGVLASALCMDKRRTKIFLENQARYNIRMARWLWLDDKQSFREELHELLQSDARSVSNLSKQIGSGPWFVKPSGAGSSVGVTKVHSTDQLERATEAAFTHDDTVLIEEAVVGREIEVAVVGSPPHHKASGLGEIVTGDTFYDYNEKYSASSTVATSANVSDLPEKLTTSIRQQALDIYSALGCQGLARVDFFVTDTQQVYFNEVNTMPGFTDISMYPQLWQAAGTSYAELVSALIDGAQKDRG